MITFQNRGTVLESFHPVLKMVVLVTYCVALFMSDDLFRTALLLGLLALMYIMARLSPRRLGGLRFIITLSLSLVLINVLFTRDGDPLIKYHFLLITREGIENGILKASLFVGVIFSSMLFVSTTNTSQFVNGIMQIGVPYRYAYMIVTSMSLAPVFQIEASTVRNAQVARGLRIDAGSVGKIMKMARFTFIPLIMSALSKVDSLTISMEGRAFGIYKKRSYYRKCSMGASDVVSFSLSMAALLLIILY
ncbi:MAG TPA: energy-coupling factor transporter transmembrane component T [Candidatus Methanofastidiosa archaeon]|nr:energy-coupling factor transporter transmembrane component T [Candidatus Methanofastidiosa archaeon]